MGGGVGGWLTVNLVFCFGPKLWFWTWTKLNNINQGSTLFQQCRPLCQITFLLHVKEMYPKMPEISSITRLKGLSYACHTNYHLSVQIFGGILSGTMQAIVDLISFCIWKFDDQWILQGPIIWYYHVKMENYMIGELFLIYCNLNALLFYDRRFVIWVILRIGGCSRHS